MSKLIITQNLEDTYVKMVKEVIPDWEIIVGRDPSIWESHLKEAEIIVGWKKEIQEYCLQSGSKLHWLQTWSAGVNSLPLRELDAQNIKLTSANGVHAYPISETIFALMLGLTRKIHTYVNNQNQKKWHHSDLKLEIHEKTVGIIGVGAIGKETAKLAKAFGMTVLGVRHSGKPEEFVDEMYTPDQLHKILPACDYVIVTLPLTKETHHMFNKKEFNLMKPTSFFINIGRGEIVNEEDLINALLTEQIAGAGLDVFEKEPLSKESPLWDFENVIITPHTSGSTEHYTKRVIEDIFIPNLKGYIAGDGPTVNVVNYKKGY
ncbi:D-2-hydroxyacid dehydrogenase [Fredinandcohnia quinoae]|uniref:D-2-hydroxyacid dehydrogenase n=1 Tax=Fredinandcohnia quinoae TaxID=2918902 RepID=A0AAW5E4L6_9BACI|nr:D-2-hydroxyacid dehydrogenase [Fredinandcohnia sp. SECRCQ15]MCH1624296.1 D-2-hydroxyacid dehydrogenase [Fredinandcohnia sp. SECRCQ15]